MVSEDRWLSLLFLRIYRAVDAFLEMRRLGMVFLAKAAERSARFARAAFGAG